MTRLPKCACGKVWAPTRQQAEAVREFIAKGRSDSYHVNYYMCEYKAWHWTRQQIWRDHSERVRPSTVLRSYKRVP